MEPGSRRWPELEVWPLAYSFALDSNEENEARLPSGYCWAPISIFPKMHREKAGRGLLPWWHRGHRREGERLARGNRRG